MSKKNLSDKDFVKEYEEATNIPEILSTTTLFYFSISLPILITILVVSKLQFPFFPDAYKGMIDWLLLLFSIAAVLIILSSVIYTMIIIIGFPTKRNRHDLRLWRFFVPANGKFEDFWRTTKAQRQHALP